MNVRDAEERADSLIRTVRDRPVEERDGADARRRPPRVRHLSARARGGLRRGRVPDDHAPHPLRQDGQAVHRDRRLLRPEGVQRGPDRPARPLLLRGKRRLLPRRHAAHRSGWLRHLRVDRRPTVVERADRHGRQLLRGDHPGAHCAREPTAPDRHLAGRGPDEQLPEPVSRGRRDAAAHVLGALHPRAGRSGHHRRLEQAAGRVERPTRSPPALPGDPVGAWPDVAPARSSARGLAARLLHARRLRRVLGPGRAQLHALLGSARGHPGDDVDRLVRPFPDRRHRVLLGDDGAESPRRCGSSSARGATSACAATRRSVTRSTSGRTASGA